MPILGQRLMPRAAPRHCRSAHLRALATVLAVTVFGCASTGDNPAAHAATDTIGKHTLGGAFAGLGGGIQASIACGPLIPICLPYMAAAGVAIGTVGGAIVGGVKAANDYSVNFRPQGASTGPYEVRGSNEVRGPGFLPIEIPSDAATDDLLSFSSSEPFEIRELSSQQVPSAGYVKASLLVNLSEPNDKMEQSYQVDAEIGCADPYLTIFAIYAYAGRDRGGQLIRQYMPRSGYATQLGGWTNEIKSLLGGHCNPSATQATTTSNSAPELIYRPLSLPSSP